MAKQNFSHYVKRDKPKKRPGKHKKSLSQSEKNNNKHKKYQGQGRQFRKILILFTVAKSHGKQKV